MRSERFSVWPLHPFIALLVIGALIGGIVAMRVEMIRHAASCVHSFVGMAAVFIGINSDIMPLLAGAEKIIQEIFVGVSSVRSPYRFCYCLWQTVRSRWQAFDPTRT